MKVIIYPCHISHACLARLCKWKSPLISTVLSTIIDNHRLILESISSITESTASADGLAPCVARTRLLTWWWPKLCWWSGHEMLNYRTLKLWHFLQMACYHLNTLAIFVSMARFGLCWLFCTVSIVPVDGLTPWGTMQSPGTMEFWFLYISFLLPLHKDITCNT